MNLQPEERVLFTATPSWKSQLWPHSAVLLVSIAIGSLLVWILDNDVLAIAIAVLLFVVGTGWFWIERVRTRYTITTERLNVREGFLAKQTQETRLGRIQNVTVSQSVPERILGIGTVDYDTAGADSQNFRMLGVADPDQLVRIVNQAQQDLENRNVAAEAEAEAQANARYRDTEVPGPAQPAPTQQPLPPNNNQQGI